MLIARRHLDVVRSSDMGFADGSENCLGGGPAALVDNSSSPSLALMVYTGRQNDLSA